MSDVVIKSVKKGGRKSGGSKKYGRNEKKCAKYRAQGRREKNRARKLAKNIKREIRLDALREKRA